MAKQSILKEERDDEYRPTRDSKSCLKKKKHQAVSAKHTNSSKWTAVQNENFLNFIQKNRQLLLCPLKRKEERVFLQLSKAIETRTPDQCRSHHQKMVKHHNDLDGIIEHLNQRLYGIGVKNKEENEIQHAEPNSDKNTKSQEFFSFETNLDFEVIKQEPEMENIWDVFDKEIWVQKMSWEIEGNSFFENN